jgi:DNA N-6-adenine-methyltransferase (Dam)
MVRSQPRLTLAEAHWLYAKFAGSMGDDAIRAMAEIALTARHQQAGWGKLRLLALRELGTFLIRNGKGRGRPAKMSPADNLQSLVCLGITDRHISADAKNVARISQRDFDAYLAQEDEPTLKGLLRAMGGMARPHVAAQIDFERTTTEWFTPPEIFEAMEAEFDLDVASPGARKVPWLPARKHLTIRDDGLKQPWHGFIWMNPPYGLRNGMEQWIERFIEHGNGVALVVDFTSTEWWQNLTERSDFILFVRPKIQFLPKSDGRMNCLGSTLVAIGDAGIRALRNAERNGRGICFRRDASTRLHMAAAAE